MRLQSNHPLKNGGWLHQPNNPRPSLPVRVAPTPIMNVPEILERFARGSSRERIDSLALQLGVATSALIAFGCLWSQESTAWAIPERDASGTPIGICLRYQDGKKRMVPGSHRGLAIPQCDWQSTLYICEGLSDSAAALTLGFYAIGRYSCSGGVDLVKDYVARHRFTRAVIVADLNDVGVQGAVTLQEHMTIPSCVLVPPGKDLRWCVNNGMTRELMEAMIKGLIWRHPQIA